MRGAGGRVRDEVLVRARAMADGSKRLTRKQRELEGKEGRVNMFTLTVGREIDNEIAEEAKKHYAAVLDAAAADSGYTVTEIGPYSRQLSQSPRFSDAYDEDVVYVFQNHASMEEGESVGPVTDVAERRSHVISCVKVEPLEPADITRRQFERRRKFFLQWQVRNSQQQAFTKAQLESRTGQHAAARGEGERMRTSALREPASSEQPEAACATRH